MIFGRLSIRTLSSFLLPFWNLCLHLLCSILNLLNSHWCLMYLTTMIWASHDMHVTWGSLGRNILWMSLQTNRRMSSWNWIINLRRLISWNHLVLLGMLSLWHHNRLNKLNLLLSISWHLLRINRLHLKRLSIIIEVTWNLGLSIWSLAFVRRSCLIYYFDSLLVSLCSYHLLVMNYLRWIMAWRDDSGGWLVDLGCLLMLFYIVLLLTCHIWIVHSMNFRVITLIILLDLLMLLMNHLFLLIIGINRIWLHKYVLDRLICLLWNALLRYDLLNDVSLVLLMRLHTIW